MSDAIFSAYEALDARMRLVDIIANNLANVQTTGFKRDFGQVFEELIDEDVTVQVRSQIDLNQGELISTGRTLDAAIDGEGFFVIETDGGPRYTRNGSFQVNADGDLVVQDGHRVLGDGDAPIFVGQGAVRIQDGGDILVDENVVGSLRLVTFDEPALVEKEGLFRLRYAGDPAGVRDALESRVKGAHLERSNVNSVGEMVELMSAFREFESVGQTLRSITSEMDKQLLAELADLT